MQLKNGLICYFQDEEYKTNKVKVQIVDINFSEVKFLEDMHGATSGKLVDKGRKISMISQIHNSPHWFTPVSLFEFEE